MVQPSTRPTIYLGADHGGYELKQRLAAHLADRGYEVRDLGTYSADAVDYPDFAFLVARAVADAAPAAALGVIVDGIGQASAIVANKVAGIRAVAGYDAFAVCSSREHLDANVLCLGGQVLGPGLARDLVDRWLATPFGGGRHQSRLDKITRIEGRSAVEQR